MTLFPPVMPHVPPIAARVVHVLPAATPVLAQITPIAAHILTRRGAVAPVLTQIATVLPDVTIVVSDIAAVLPHLPPVVADLTPGLGSVCLLRIELDRSGCGQRERKKDGDTASHGMILVKGRQ